MRVFSIKAVDRGTIFEVATVDSAKQALIQYLDALDRYNCAWVSDQSEGDIQIDELVRLAQDDSEPGKR